MNAIQTALYNRQIKRLTREYQALNALNASEQSIAAKATVSALLADFDRGAK